MSRVVRVNVDVVDSDIDAPIYGNRSAVAVFDGYSTDDNVLRPMRFTVDSAIIEVNGGMTAGRRTQAVISVVDNDVANITVFGAVCKTDLPETRIVLALPYRILVVEISLRIDYPQGIEIETVEILGLNQLGASQLAVYLHVGDDVVAVGPIGRINNAVNHGSGCKEKAAVADGVLHGVDSIAAGREENVSYRTVGSYGVPSRPVISGAVACKTGLLDVQPVVRYRIPYARSQVGPDYGTVGYHGRRDPTDDDLVAAEIKP